MNTPTNCIYTYTNEQINILPIINFLPCDAKVTQ